MSAYKTNCEKQEFQIDGCVTTKAFIGDTGLTFTPDIYNAEKIPVTWELVSFSGDIQNVVIDATTGEVTYDAASGTLTNDGNSSFIVKATDACGKVFTKDFCFRISDPVTDIPLACNADMGANLPDIAAKYTLFAKVDETSVFQDVAKTSPSSDGDVVSALEDGNGNGDITVRTGDNPPTLNIGGAPNNNNYLDFSGSNQALQYDVPSAPVLGTPFKLFALVRIDTASNDTNATVMSSTLQSANDSLANSTWQLSRSENTDQFVFRFDNPPASIQSGSLATGSTGDMYMAGWDSGIRDGGWHLIYINYDGTTVKGFYDGVEVFEATPSSPLAGKHFKFGENRGGNSYIAMDLAEAIYADSTLTDEEATQTQAYFLCKFGLDAALISDPGPFAIDLDNCYSQISQFRYQKLSNGSVLVYDTLNNTYYDIGDVPTPELGLLEEPICGGDGDTSTLSADFTTGTKVATHSAGGVDTDIFVPDIPSNTSDLTNDSGFITLSDLPADSDDQTLTITETDEFTTTVEISNGNSQSFTHVSRKVGSWLKTELTNFAHDLASTVDAVLPIMGNTVANEIGATVDNTAHTVTIGEAGRYDLLANISFSESSGNTQRNNIKFYITVNGVQQGRNYQDNYLRDFSGHNEVGQTVSYKLDLSVGDVISIRRDQIAGSGGVVTAEAGVTHDLILTRIK